MNYLGHFILNHEIHGAAAEPYFVAGVALPDLWNRYSRSKRLHWPSVRAAQPEARPTADLRLGLLNHVAADQRFHTSPVFLRWLRTVKEHAPEAERGTVATDFVAHVAIELVLDHHLAVRFPDRAEEFCNVLQRCQPAEIARSAMLLGRVDTRGLGHEFADFVRRRFVPLFADWRNVETVLQYVLSLIRVRPLPGADTQARLLEAARVRVAPEVLWADLTRRSTPLPLPESAGAAARVRA